MDTIATASALALTELGKPSSINEIYVQILKAGHYTFSTPVPEHVIRTTIRRHTENVDRSDASDEVLFTMTEDEIYGLIPKNIQGGRKKMQSGTRRIQRSADKENIIKRLTSENEIFREIWRLLLFSAQVGWRKQKRVALAQTDTGKGIDQSTFGNCPSWPGLILMMAVAESNSEQFLGGDSDTDQERIKIFEEYANGGLEVIDDFFSDRSANIEGIIALIESLGPTRKETKSIDLDFTLG